MAEHMIVWDLETVPDLDAIGGIGHRGHSGSLCSPALSETETQARLPSCNGLARDKLVCCVFYDTRANILNVGNLHQLCTPRLNHISDRWKFRLHACLETIAY
jgi:hypothetical protein